MRPSPHITAGFGWREHPGDGPVLVALHGIGAEARAFDAMAAHLPDWRVIAWEAPGYGPSTALPNAWPVAADYATSLGVFLTALDLSRVHLMGHSLGTLIGAAFARQAPQRVASLTLAACAQGGGCTPGKELPPAQAARLTDLSRLGAATFARNRAPRLIYQPDQHPDLVSAVADGMRKVLLPGYTQAVRMLASGDLAADCAQLQVSTAVVVGSEDIVTPPDQSRTAYSALAPAQRGAFTLIPNTGHALHQQAPAMLAQAIRDHAHKGTTP